MAATCSRCGEKVGFLDSLDRDLRYWTNNGTNEMSPRTNSQCEPVRWSHVMVGCSAFTAKSQGSAIGMLLD